MHRTEGLDHVANKFDPGDPLVPRLGTEVEHKFLNAVQEELAKTIEGAGLTVRTQSADVTATYGGQLLAAILKLQPVRAFGVVETSNPAGTAPALLAGSMNLGTPSLIAGTPNRIRVPFATPLADANYTVVLTDCNTAGNPSSQVFYTFASTSTASYVDVKAYFAGAEVDPATLAGRRFSLTVLKV